ncbi:MAG: glutathione peroxidase [Planctomycetota bacterium]|nr:MAG: glutathione peroxidase [Planctomycetota bacterium]
MFRPTALLLLAAAGCAAPAAEPHDSFFDLSAESLAGETVDFASFSGRPVLVVNTASRCGFTPQYAGLEELHRRYGPRGLVVLGFPCNQFRGQEPGTAAEIRAFCSEEYGVTFPLMAKVEVLAGPGQSPVFADLGRRSGRLPEWNFAKYLVSPDGRSVRFFPTQVPPDDPELIAAIEAALGG